MRSPGLAPGAPGLEWGPTSPTQPQEPDEPGASPGPLQEIADVDREDKIDESVKEDISVFDRQLICI